jgi:hypothetical protein
MTEKAPTALITLPDINARTRADANAAEVAADAMRTGMKQHDKEAWAGYDKSAIRVGELAVSDIIRSEREQAATAAQVESGHIAAIEEDIDRKSHKDPEFAQQLANRMESSMAAHLQDPTQGFDVGARESAVDEGKFINNTPQREAAHLAAEQRRAA